MKKLLLAINFAIITLNINAQLVVDSLGRVGIGIETPKSFLSVGASGIDNAALFCKVQRLHYKRSQVVKMEQRFYRIEVLR